MNLPSNLPGEKAGTVLVVEDESFTRRVYQAGLEKAGWRVLAASSVEEAKRIVLGETVRRIDCVVSDHSLGEETGLDFLHWVKELEASLAVLLITAGTEKQLVEESLRGGACDFLNKPVGGAQLVEAVRRAAEQTARQRRLLETQQAALGIGEVQRRLLGAATPFPGVRVEICFHPKHEAGGDFICQHHQDGRFFHFMTTDASGHDLKAAFVSAYFQGMVRGMIENSTPVSEMFSAFNRYLCREWNADNLAGGITSLAASSVTIDVKQQEAVVLVCGNPAPVYVSDEGALQIPGRGGGSYPLGWFEDAELQPIRLPIQKGGAFYTWSDGLEDLSIDLGVHPLSMAASLLAFHREGRRHPALDRAGDDVMVARLDLGGEEGGAAAFRPVLFESRAAADAASVDEWQQGWRRSLLTALPSLPEETAYKALLCCREALLNGLKHGCAGGGRATLEVVVDERCSKLRVTVSDPGPGHDFDFMAHEERAAEDLLHEHRGLVFMKHLADSMKLERRGASITLDFRLSEDPERRCTG